MFIQNKYYRWYQAIIERDDLDGYRERHHKMPRAFGGNDSKSNIVLLSARRHFLAHWLLTKCTEGENLRSMLWAFACMSRNPSGDRNLSAWQYARARAAYQQAALGRSSNFKGRTHSPESRNKMSLSRIGRKHSDQHKANIAKGLQGKKCGWPIGRPRAMTDKQREEYSARMRGNKFRLGSSPSADTRAKLSAASKGNKSKSGMKDSVETRQRKRAAQLRQHDASPSLRS